MIEGEEFKATSITELIKMIATRAVFTSDILIGNIISVSPLKITLANDAKIILSPVNLVVPEHLRERKETITFTFHGETQSRTITIHEALKAGEQVYLLAYNNGKKYFVVDRI